MDGMAPEDPGPFGTAMRGAVVYKMSGSGNDFVFVDGRMSPLHDWGSDAIRRVCDRRSGVGADGFAVLEPGSSAGRVRFHFFNRDGTRAPMCGNGALCATQLACLLELVPGPQMVLETDAGGVSATVVTGDNPRAQFSTAGLADPTVPDIPLQNGERSIHLVNVGGLPHLVILVDEVSSVQLPGRGRELRHDSAVAPAGANVNFVGTDHDSAQWRMRTYERGVEAETLACGTGAVACAGALIWVQAITELPWDVRTSSGQLLTIGGTIQDSARLVSPTLTGEARLVFKAVLS
jgi:diaminopimelate epimerase